MKGQLDMQWKDVTTFSQVEKDRTPQTWVAMAGDFRIVVTRHRDYPPEKWILQCAPFFDIKELAPTDIELAKASALDLVKGRLSTAMNAINI
jgi:hypothetical protein